MKKLIFGLMGVIATIFLLSALGIASYPASAHMSIHSQLASVPVNTNYRLTNATSITFTDGDFSVGWTQISVVTDDPRSAGPGLGTSFGSSVQQTSGGNPDAFRRSSHTVVYGDDIFTGGLNTSAVYTPSGSGTIATVDFAIDLLEDPAIPGESAWQLLLEQEGTLYYSVPLQIFSNSVWQSFKQNGLTAADFDTNPNVGVPGAIPDNQQPDFTTQSAPITFGYVVGNGVIGSGTLTLSHRVDNWSVTINVGKSVFLPIVSK